MDEDIERRDSVHPRSQKENARLLREMPGGHILDIRLNDIYLNEEERIREARNSGATDDCVEDITFLCKYINGPTIIDSFPTHDARREWRRSLPHELVEFYRENKLRANILHSTVFFLHDLSEQNGIDIKEELECIDEGLKDYNILTTEEKLQFIDKVDAAAIKILYSLPPEMVTNDSTHLSTLKKIG